MLVKFISENFLSFKDEIVLNMIASTDSAHESHVIADATGKKIPLLRAAALYGANASGKSNFIKAIRFARDFVVDGTTRDESIAATPFKLSRESLKKPIRFEFLIKHRGLLYHYGFVLTREQVLEEWLYVTKKGPKAKWFERATTPAGKTRVDLGPSLKRRGTRRTQFLQFVGEGTRPNRLFLSEANDKNVDELKPLFDWFRTVVHVITPEGQYDPLFERIAKDSDFRRFVAKFLELVDTAIRNIETVRVKLDYGRVSSLISEDELGQTARLLRKMGSPSVRAGGLELTFNKEDNGRAEVLKMLTTHAMADDPGSPVRFGIDEESDGTRRLIDLAGALIDLSNRERVFFIDELDRSLHPMLTRLFVEQFLSSVPPESQSQLIFTTHETHLLDLELLRRDEIWFLEKDKTQSSVLYSLSDFKPRKDLRIEKGYLQGRFGAIPFLGNMSQLDLGSAKRSRKKTGRRR